MAPLSGIRGSLSGTKRLISKAVAFLEIPSIPGARAEKVSAFGVLVSPCGYENTLYWTGGSRIVGRTLGATPI